MKWVKKGSRHLCHPYQILVSIQGFDLWVRDGSKYTELRRRIPYLDDAKAYAASHKAQALPA